MSRVALCVIIAALAGDVLADEAFANEAFANEAFANEAKDAGGGVIRLDETVISGNQELPKVLYILPWQQPEGLPEIDVEVPDSEAEVFRRLYPPAYRRELEYFRSLEEAAAQ